MSYLKEDKNYNEEEDLDYAPETPIDDIPNNEYELRNKTEKEFENKIVNETAEPIKRKVNEIWNELKQNEDIKKPKQQNNSLAVFIYSI